MKTINKLLLIGALLFTFMPNINASTITWQDITNEWQQLNDENMTITYDESNLKITSSAEDFDYALNFKYENNIINLIPQDKTNLTEEQRATHAMWDSLLTLYMLATISKLYDIDFTQINEENYQNYGITIEGTEITYENKEEDMNVSITATDITKFSIDLNKFEEATASLKGTYEEDKEITITKPTTVNLSLEKTNLTSLELSVNVNNLSESSTASCDIYMIPTENNIESKLIGTINNCINGKNLYTITELSPNNTYTFKVVLNEKINWSTSEKIENTILGDYNYTFSTLSENYTETITNPKTGNSFTYIAILTLIISVISISLILKNKKATI